MLLFWAPQIVVNRLIFGYFYFINKQQISNFQPDYLVNNIMVEPRQLLNEMSNGIGLQFQGEWALYLCSMLAEALTNMAELYPETKDVAITTIDSLIQIVKSPDLRLYDRIRWCEDPLESLDGDKSHVSYLSHLAWMIGNYRKISRDSRYNHLHD